MNITDHALACGVITLEESILLDNFLDSDEWDDEHDMPEDVRKVYEVTLQHYLNGKLH